MHTPITLKDRLVNIYKGLIKYNSVGFSRTEFVLYFTNNKEFNALFLLWTAEGYSHPTKPTIWYSGDTTKTLQLSDLILSQTVDRHDNRELKIKTSMLKKYGVTNPMHSDICKARLKETNREKYGSDNCFSNEEVKAKIKKTNRKNLGVDYPTQNKEILKKRVNSYRKRYGVDNPNKNKGVRQKTISTCLKRYGTDNPSKNKKVIKKIIKTKGERGVIQLIDGRTKSDLAVSAGKASAWSLKLYNEYGEKAFLNWINHNILPAGNNQTKLEKSITKEIGIEFFNRRVLKKRQSRPDFKLTDTTYLDVDGLFWHSEAVTTLTSYPGVSKTYHKDKRVAYENEGKQLLQLRESELNEKLAIIKSMIHKVTKPESFQKIFARKCTISTLSTEDTHKFILENHLQGPGHRLKGVFLLHNGIPVMCMSIKKAINKVNDQDTFEISRMCSKTYTVVVGGASKLLKYIEMGLPSGSILKTAADLRYSNGSTYEKLGFEFYKEDLSFGWTDLKTVYHRLKVHRDSDAKKLGLFKIWDAGQRYYIKHIK